MKNKYEDAIKVLEDNGIKYEAVEHPPAFTTEEADKYIEGKIGCRTKTMFMTDQKKRRFYMLVMDDKDRLDMKEFAEIAHEKRVKMASEETLFNKLGNEAGCVSPFGLINDEEKEVQFYFDNAILKEEIMTFHPNINTQTLFFKTEDLFKMLKNMGYEVHFVDLNK